MLALACSDTRIKQLPADISKRIIASVKCDLIVYSSNDYGYFAPNLIYNHLDKSARKYQRFPHHKQNTYAQSISWDCRYLSALREVVEKNCFEIIIYDLQKRSELPIDFIEGGRYSTPLFSPRALVLAYLHEGNLNLLNIESNEKTSVPLPRIAFKNLVWSATGKYLFLEDHLTNIWRYVAKDKSLSLIWEAPLFSYSDRMLTPSGNDEESFYFLSDHESEYTQIYQYLKNGRARLRIESKYDKSLFKRAIYHDTIPYREFRNGDVIVLIRVGEEESRQIGPAFGVVYDYVPYPKNINLMIYANYNHSVSLVSNSRQASIDLLGNKKIVNSLKPKIIYNRDGMINLIYFPKSVASKWLVWLHGGPYEQMSPRYNNYIYSLTKKGIGVIVVNYPGSTGIGNRYEMRGNENELIDAQLVSLREDLLAIKKFYPQVKKYALLGVSYGSILVSKYAEKYESDISQIIDYSGLTVESYPVRTPVLFIYGEHDYSLANNKRVKMLREAQETGDAKVLVLGDEGHVVSNRYNTIKVIKEINSFLMKN